MTPSLHPLPAYARTDHAAQEQLRVIADDLFFRGRDTRLARVFFAIVAYAQSHKDGLLYVEPLFQFALKKGNTGISVEINLRSSILDVFHVLEKNGYARSVAAEGGGEPESFILTDPAQEKILQHLQEIYGRAEGYAPSKSRIPKIGSFPTSAQIIVKFSLGADQAQGLFVSATEREFNDDFLRKNPDRLIVYLFQEGGQPVDVVVPSEMGMGALVRLAAGLLQRFQTDHQRFGDEIRSRLNQIQEMNKHPFETLLAGIQSGQDIPPENRYLHWSNTVRVLAFSPEFRSHPERYLTISEEEGVGGTAYAWVGQAAAIVHHGLLNAREGLKKKQWAKEAENADRKKIIGFLVEDTKNVVSLPSGDIETMFRPVTMAQLLSQTDNSGQLNLGDKYGPENIVQVLRMDGDEVIPQIIRLPREGSSIFFHRWRLFDVYYGEKALERARVVQKLVEKWTAPEGRIPKEQDFEIESELLTPFFLELLNFSWRACDAYLTLDEMVKIFFPSAVDVTGYKLVDSDLAFVEGSQNATPRDRCTFFREALYAGAWSPDKKGLAEVLELDYDDIVREAKSRRKQVKRSSAQLNGFLDRTLYRFVNAVVNFFMSLFSGSAKAASEKPVAEGAEREARPRHASPSQGAMTHEEASERFGLPSDRMELKAGIEKHLAEWNQVFLDPKTIYPDWNRYSAEDKDRYKKKLEEEARSRKKQAKEKVDTAIDRWSSHFDLKGISKRELDEKSEDFAKQFRENNIAPLAAYIRDSLVYRLTYED